MNNNIRNNYFFPSKAIEHSTIYDVHTLLQTCIDLNGDTSNSLYKKCILALVYVCDFLTVEELTLYLGFPESCIHSLTRILYRLEEQKLLKRVDFKEKDSSSKGAYYLTKEGWQQANSYFDTLQIKEYRRKSANNVTVMHDFAVGMNALSLILFGIPFTYGKEISEGTSLKTGKKINRTLTYDALVIFRKGTNINRPERLYIEEDLGHETIRTLVDKLNSYEAYGITKKVSTEAVVFSIKKTASTSSDAYSVTRIGALKSFLQDKGYSSLLELLNALKTQNTTPEDIPRKVLDTAKILSLVIGLCDRNGKIHTKNDMSIPEMDKYILSLQELKNPYKAIEVNRQQDHLSIAKFRKVAAMAINDYRLNANNYKQPYMEDLMQGFCVWFVPTVLLINYLPVICETISLRIKKVGDLLKNQGFTYMAQLSDQYREDFANRLTLRNMFTYKNRYFSFDFISRDIGACLRALRFRETYLTKENNTTFVGIVETTEDAVVLSGETYLNYFYEMRSEKAGSLNDLVFILKQDFFSGNLGFFLVSKDGKKMTVSI